MNKILEVTNLRKEYPNFTLENVSFAIEPKSIVGFIGINGSGKTTTIKAILGLISSTSERLNYFGLPFVSDEKGIKNRLGVVPDEGYFYETLTVNQMKSIVAPVYDRWEEDVFQELIAKFGLKRKQKLATLSKGMKMKFSIALALAHHAELIVMDEPTSGLDPLVRNELMDILEEVVEKEECSILFSTHIISDLEQVADRIIFMDRGKIIFEENQQKLKETYQQILGKDDVSVEEIMLYHIKGGWK